MSIAEKTSEAVVVHQIPALMIDLSKIEGTADA